MILLLISALVTTIRSIPTGSWRICPGWWNRGPTSDPETVVEWAHASGAQITLDVGHAVSCQSVQDAALTPLDSVDMFTDRLAEVHMYERESDRHYPAHDMSVLGPIVDRLLDTQCRWWTIELDDPGEALATRSVLLDYLQVQGEWQASRQIEGWEA